jgi:hypothetical protein
MLTTRRRLRVMVSSLDLTRSEAEFVAAGTGGDTIEAIAELSDAQCHELLWSWRFWARPNQLPPEGDWLTWLILAGRGFG